MTCKARNIVWTKIFSSGMCAQKLMDVGDVLKRNSAPTGTMVKRSLTKVSNALHPTRSSHMAQGLSDSTFQQAPAFHLTALDAQTASALSAWSAKVVKGEIQVPHGLERAEQLARDIQVLAGARVSLLLLMLFIFETHALCLSWLVLSDSKSAQLQIHFGEGCYIAIYIMPDSLRVSRYAIMATVSFFAGTWHNFCGGKDLCKVSRHSGNAEEIFGPWAVPFPRQELHIWQWQGFWYSWGQAGHCRLALPPQLSSFSSLRVLCYFHTEQLSTILPID